MEFIGLIVLAVLVMFYIMMKKPSKNIKQISTEELKSMLGDKNKQFIDVRTPGEYKNNHIKQFKNMPLNSLPKNDQSLSKDKEIIVICQSGMRSANACKVLEKKGFTSITNVRGGMNSWSH
ncbi:rhodanese-like domain-containing protein [Rossellomorea aquimaris]|uniref:rhodanese-like domain-containing protein n=1 Tax=Rossellomorea TaxID=2837508 RepID=UPI001CD3C82C|nr:rhodanese-like domain-containing protein [Rossellomorea aquimaris]MCA1058642.1 rhodanese-like domain-containing protein [Rossellomorea aquimaris]